MNLRQNLCLIQLYLLVELGHDAGIAVPLGVVYQLDTARVPVKGKCHNREKYNHRLSPQRIQKALSELVR